MSNTPAIGGGVILSPLDYLDPAVNRPDLYAEKTINRSSISKGVKTNGELLSSIIIIILSAFIFVTIVAWFSVLQLWFDEMFVAEAVHPAVTSRLYYAIVTTIITIAVSLLVYIFYHIWRTN